MTLSKDVAAQGGLESVSKAERVASLILNEFPVSWVRLELHKPGAVPEAETVGVVIERRAATGWPAGPPG